MSSVRVTYSGLISFLIGIIGIISGLVFTILITRTLSINEYGTWGFITSLLVYIVIFEPIVSYWVTREVARDINSGKTGVFVNSLFSLIGILGYIVLSYVFATKTDVQLSSIIFASILIPVIFVNRTLIAINLAWKPEITSYGSLSLSLTQIPMGIIFLIIYPMGIFGVIITVFISHIVSIIVQTILGKQQLYFKINRNYIRKWLKLSWIPLFPGIASFIQMSGVIVFSIITGSVEGVALWTAATAITIIISQSNFISRSMYPKLLDNSKSIFSKTNLSLFFYFAIPLTLFSITFSKPILFAFNPVYEIAFPIAMILSINVFANAVAMTFQWYITGSESIDTQHNLKFHQLLQSYLFKIPLLFIIQYSAYIITLIVFLITFFTKMDTFDLVLYWAIIITITQIPISVYMYHITKKQLRISVELKHLGKYILAGGVSFGFSYFLLNKVLVYNPILFEFIPSLITLSIFSFLCYVIITYLIDSNTRLLISAIFKELKKH